MEKMARCRVSLHGSTILVSAFLSSKRREKTGRKPCSFDSFTLFTHLPADFLEQAKVSDPAERYISDSFVHFFNVLHVKFKSRFTGGSIFTERFCQ